MTKTKAALEENPISPDSLISHVEIGIEALLGSATMTVADLNALKEGDEIRLDQQINEPVALIVNGKTLARGEIVTVNDCFAVRLTQIGE